MADQDAYQADADAVTLITLHAAKGLEFDVGLHLRPGGGRLPARACAR